MRKGEEPPATSTTDLRAVVRRRIEQVLLECRGTKSTGARRLGLTRKELYGRLRVRALA